MPTLLLKNAGPLLRRTIWMQGQGRVFGFGDYALGAPPLAGQFGQATGSEMFYFDVWQLQTGLSNAGYSVTKTGKWNDATLVALKAIASRWDDTFIVDAAVGDDTILVMSGTKAGKTQAYTNEAWGIFLETVSGLPPQPAPIVAAPAPAPAPVVVTTTTAPAPTVVTSPAPAPAPEPAWKVLRPPLPNAESVGYLEARVALKAVGYFTANVTSGTGDAAYTWDSRTTSAFSRWAAARALSYQSQPDLELSDPTLSNPDFMQIAPREVIDALFAEANRESNEQRLWAALREADIDLSDWLLQYPKPTEPSVSPPAPTPRVPTWAYIIGVAGLVGGAFALMDRRKRRRRRR